METRCGVHSVSCAIFIAATFSLGVSTRAAADSGTLLTGKAAMGDWTSDAPGVRRKITVPKDGSLLISEDGTGTIWRVSYRK
jgi:glucose/arabinose dehydrogenase